MKRQHRLLALGVAVTAGLLLAACGGDDDDGGDSADTISGPEIKIGAQDFGESQVLAEIYKQALENNGIKATTVDVGGFRDLLFGAFESGDVNMAIDYVASELEFLNDFAGEATHDVDETLGKLEPLLEEKDLVAYTPSEAINTNVFVVTEEYAEENGVSKVSDLTGDETLGGPQDCESNAYCVPGLQRVYDIDMSEDFTPLDSSLVVSTLESGDIDVGVLFSTDAVLEQGGLVVLEDDQDMTAADNIFPVATTEVADAYGDDLAEVLDAVSAELTTDELLQLNTSHDVDHEDPDAIAEAWLEDHSDLNNIL